MSDILNSPNDNVERSIGRLEGKLDALVLGIGELKASFDSMEKGRLSRLEVAFATLESEVSTKAKNTSFFYSIIGTVVASVLSALLVFWLIHQ